METKLNKVEKPCLLDLPNPHYEDLIQKYSHLNGVKMVDNDKKDKLPIHVVLGACDYGMRQGYPGRVINPHYQVTSKVVFDA